MALSASTANRSTLHLSSRNDDLDALRGLLLVLMTVTHLPTLLSHFLAQPFGYASAAEGFVLLSAFLAGKVYGAKLIKAGAPAMRSAVWSRAAKVYRYHLALLMFGLTVVLSIGIINQQFSITGLFSFYLAQPVLGVLAGLGLVYQPPLLDVLPMYVLFLLATPILLSTGARHGWGWVLGTSIAVWTLSQLGLREVAHSALVSATGLPIPQNATGSFNLLSWQLIWVIGLWLGSQSLSAPQVPAASARLALPVSLAVVLGFLVWRHAVGHSAFGAGHEWNALVHKWDLGALRLVNVLAITVLIAHLGPMVARRLPLQPLAQLGKASLPVFAAHLVCCLLALAFFGSAARPNGSLGLDLSLLVGTFAVLQITAAVYEWNQSRARQAQSAATSRQPA